MRTKEKITFILLLIPALMMYSCAEQSNKASENILNLPEQNGAKVQNSEIKNNDQNSKYSPEAVADMDSARAEHMSKKEVESYVNEKRNQSTYEVVDFFECPAHLRIVSEAVGNDEWLAGTLTFSYDVNNTQIVQFPYGSGYKLILGCMHGDFSDDIDIYSASKATRPVGERGYIYSFKVAYIPLDYDVCYEVPDALGFLCLKQ